ncbi:MAG: hypothetical protein MUO91_06410 [candidate division Zixibacteria bacterium]|nr:hypothetical protein [candidate division Zixibacteria bacterium]
MLTSAKNWRRTILLLFFLLNNCQHCLSQNNTDSNFVQNIQIYLVGDGRTVLYQLGDYYILEGSEKVKKVVPGDGNGSSLERDKDYTFDYNNGLITFPTPLSNQDSLWVSYQKLNLNLRKKYFHRELVYSTQDGSFGQNDESESQIIPKTKERDFAFNREKLPSDFILSGSKTFSFEVGSKTDPSLRQGLSLSARGNMSENLEVSLLLSDQNVPVTSQGTTKRLEELDKVLIQVKSPNFTGILGDYDLKLSGSQFSLYEKKLKGVRGEANVGDNFFSAALASSKGEYFSNRFQGVENKQGHYQLKGKKGETGIMILPGTERVWVDGKEMQRGSDNDYAIDYSKGSIQFTPHQLITADSRISVDFEYSVENYQRDFYDGSLGTKFFDGKLEFKATGINEKDNQDHPLSFALSSEDRNILSRAGNDIFKADKDGAEFVGEGKGDYNLAYDSLGNPYYQYVGSDSGSYQVSFSWVGEGKGSYQYKGGGIYFYVYPSNGDFLPKILLPLPQSHSLFDFALSFLPTHAFNAQIEWAKSKKDLNTFSSKDDQNNWGDAFFLKSVYENNDLGLTQLKLEGVYRFLKKDFSPFGRVDFVEKERLWDLPDDSLQANEETYQFNGVISPTKSIFLNLDYGKLNLEKAFKSQRQKLGLELFPANWISAKAKTERIESKRFDQGNLNTEGKWIKNQFSLNHRISKLSTTWGWEQEKKNTFNSGMITDGAKFNQLSSEFSLEQLNEIKASTELIYRKDDKFEKWWRDESFSYIWRNRLSLRDYKKMLSADLEFVRRIKKYAKRLDDKELPGVDTKENLLSTRLDFYPPSQIINLKFYHSQNQIHSAQRVDTYVDVGEGKGEYGYEDGEYVPDPDGNFILVTEWVGDFAPSLDLNKSIRLIFSPYKMASRRNANSFWSRLGEIFSTDSFISLSGKFGGNENWTSYFLYPLNKIPDDTVLSQNFTMRHDLYLLPDYRRLNFRLRWEKEEDENNLLSLGGEKEKVIRKKLLIKSFFSPRYLFESELEDEKQTKSWGGNLKYLINGKAFKMNLTQKRSNALELSLSTEYKRSEEKIQKLRANFFSLSPELLWSLFSYGRLKAQFKWTHLSSSLKEKGLPYQVSEGKRKGENYDWHFFFDYKFNQYITSSIIYSGEKEPGIKTEHTGKMEVKAYF